MLQENYLVQFTQKKSDKNSFLYTYISFNRIYCKYTRFLVSLNIRIVNKRNSTNRKNQFYKQIFDWTEQMKKPETLYKTTLSAYEMSSLKNARNSAIFFVHLRQLSEWFTLRTYVIIKSTIIRASLQTWYVFCQNM